MKEIKVLVTVDGKEYASAETKAETEFAIPHALSQIAEELHHQILEAKEAEIACVRDTTKEDALASHRAAIDAVYDNPTKPAKENQ